MTWNKTKHSLMALLVASVAFMGCSEETTDDPTMDAGTGGNGGMGAGGTGGMGAGGTGGMGAGGMGAGGMGAGGMGAGGMGAGGMGAGGMGGMVEDLCDGADYVDFNATAVEADGVWTFEGTTGADDFLGTCGDSMQDHADAAVLFEAPEAGFWEFQTAGTEFDTLIYIREDCADPNSELSCNDDYDGVQQSRIVAQLEAGQQAFIIVDSFQGLDANPFTLTAKTVVATAPTADMLTANYNPDQGSLGFTLTGTDPEDDVATYTLRLIDAAGETVQLLGEDSPVFTPATQGFTNVESADGSYTITFDAFLPPGTGDFASIEIVVSDAINLASDPITADAPLPPELMPEAECDPIGARNICPEGHACYDPMATGTVTCAVATAPELMTLEAFYNAETNVVAFTATGIDPENDVTGIKMKLLDAEGNPLSFGDDGQGGMVLEFEGTFDDGAAFVDAEQADGNFTLTASANLPDEFAGQVASIELVVIDSAEQESASVAADTQMPGVVDNGEPCDPLGGFNTCAGEMDVCYEADVNADEPAPICQAATAPVITGGDAYSDGDFLGVRFDGMDPENDVVAISIALLDNEGEIIVIEGQNGPLPLDFDLNTADITAADGTFMGFWGGDFFAPAMVAPAQLQITAIDNAGNESEPVVLDFGAERLMFAADEFCDSSAVVGDCPDDLFCIAGDDAGLACVEPVVECPADWGDIVDLSGALEGGLGAYMGDSTGNMSVAGAGTCGGGGPQEVLSYVAPAAGLYTFEIDAQGDTLIFARFLCGYEGGAAELACNDDIDQNNLLSRLALDLEAGQQIFIFIDGYTGRGAPGFAGPYTLTVANGN